MTVKKKPAHKKSATPQALQKAGDPFEVSQSTAKTWRRCRAKYDYAYVQLLRRKKPVVQLIRGTMIGKCLDAIAQHRVDPKAPKWQLALKPYEKEYAKLFADEKEYYGDPLGEVTRIVTRYERIYSLDGLTYLKGPDGNPYELPVRVTIAPGIDFVGHIDKMPQDKQGRTWDLDHKSHKSIPDADARFADLQQLLYQWAMPLSGYPKPIGVIWDYLRTKAPVIPETLKKGGLSQRKNMDTDYETYTEEMKRLNMRLDDPDYKEFLASLKVRGHIDFYQRVQLPSPGKDMVKSVVDDLREVAIEIKQLGGKSKIRSMDRMCKSCEYYSLCQAEFRGLDASFIRKTEYEINPDPRHVHVMDDD